LVSFNGWLVFGPANKWRITTEIMIVTLIGMVYKFLKCR